MSKYKVQIEQVIKRYEQLLSSSSSGFLTRVYQTGLDKYINRLKQYGFVEFGTVLDAGCGYGQWSLALSQLNRNVVSIDTNGEGWYRHLWEHEPNKTHDYSPKMVAAKAFNNTLEYDDIGRSIPGVDIIIKRESLLNELIRNGYDNIEHAGEGMLINKDLKDIKTSPFFQAEYEGALGVYEIIATKK